MVAICLLQKFADDQATDKMNSAILCHTQPDYMTLMKYAEGLYGKSKKVADIQNEWISNDVFINGVDTSICHSLRKY